MTIYKLYTDGSYQEKLKIAAIGGYIIAPDGEVVFKFSQPLTEPNDFKHHETLAMLYGLNKSLEKGITEIECFSDNKNISDVLNKKKFNNKDSMSILKDPYKLKLAELMDSFSFIKFNYLPREFNKEADKLAGKTLKNHKEDNLHLKKRKSFIGQEDKMLHVPNLLCEEDFQENNNNTQIFATNRKQLVYHYLIDISRNENLMSKEDLFINYYIIERNPKDHNKLSSVLIHSEEIKQLKLFITVMEGLTTIFKNSNIKDNVGLIFNATNFLRYPEMILRKRAILHKPNTDLINNFIESTNKFTKIYLHNDEKLIKNHNLLLQNNKLPITLSNKKFNINN